MTRPTARVLGLLEVLQGGGTWTASALAARLGVDQRTARRYTEHLRDLDVPVESVRGPQGGYRLAPGYRMPPLMLTDDEALAVVLGLSAVAPERLDPDHPDHPDPDRDLPGRAAVESAAAKVRRVLPRALAERLAALLAVAGTTAAPSERVALPVAEVLLLAARAVRDHRPVDLVHTGREGRTTWRRLRPYGLVAHADRWYLTGADEASGAPRTFRVDRLSALHLAEGTFEVPDDVDPRAEVLAALARSPWTHAVSVRVRAGADEVRARLPVGLATVDAVEGEDGWVRVGLSAERLDWVPGVLVALDADLVVEAPPELRELVVALGRRLVTAGQDSGPTTAPGGTTAPGT